MLQPLAHKMRERMQRGRVRKPTNETAVGGVRSMP